MAINEMRPACPVAYIPKSIEKSTQITKPDVCRATARRLDKLLPSAHNSMIPYLEPCGEPDSGGGRVFGRFPFLLEIPI